MNHTNKGLTEDYIKRLNKWASEFPVLRSCKDKRWLLKISSFPINKRNHRILILDPEEFKYHSSGTSQYFSKDDEIMNEVGIITGIFDNTNAEHHPPGGDYDLSIKARTMTPSIYVDPRIVAYGTYEEEIPYIFLPHPSALDSFKKLLPHFSKKPEILEAILDKHYSTLGIR